MRRPKNQNFEKMVGLKVHSNLNRCHCFIEVKITGIKGSNFQYFEK